jgi:hypothetical protein
MHPRLPQLIIVFVKHIFVVITVLVLGEIGREQLSVVTIRSRDSQSKIMQQKSRWLAAYSLYCERSCLSFFLLRANY